MCGKFPELFCNLSEHLKWFTFYIGLNPPNANIWKTEIVEEGKQKLTEVSLMQVQLLQPHFRSPPLSLWCHGNGINSTAVAIKSTLSRLSLGWELWAEDQCLVGSQHSLYVWARRFCSKDLEPMPRQNQFPFEGQALKLPWDIALFFMLSCERKQS